MNALWLYFLVRAAVYVAAAIVAVFLPGTGLVAFMSTFGAAIALDGIVALYVGVRSRGERVGGLIAEGIVQLVAAFVLHWSFVTGDVFARMLGVWGIAFGLAAAVTSGRMRAAGPRAAFYAGVPAFAILFGIAAFVLAPGAIAVPDTGWVRVFRTFALAAVLIAAALGSAAFGLRAARPSATG